MNKILCLALCLCILAGLAVPALAAGDAPVQTEAPAETAAPTATEAPAETIAPAATEAPATEAPVETATPAATEAPLDTLAPVEDGDTNPTATPDVELGVTSNPGTASGFLDDSDLFWLLTEGVLTISGVGAMPDFELPSAVPWASVRRSITSIVIETGVTSIGNYAFYDCANLTSLSIPGTVVTIGQGAFSGCSALTTVTLPEGVKTLKSDAFGQCTALTTLYLPLSLLDMGTAEAFAFAGCSAITDVYYSGDETTFTTYLGGNYFIETATIHYSQLPLPLSGALTDTITWSLDESYVLTITGTGAMPDYEHSEYTPWGLYRLHIKAIHIGEGITHVGDCSFSWCSNVTECTLPSTLKSIGKESFSAGAAGKTLALPQGLETIGDNAFHMNTLTSVTLPEGLKSVGKSAFLMGDITEIYIPAGCTVGEDAFQNNNIATITLGEGCTNFDDGPFHVYVLETLNLPSTIETMDIDLSRFASLESITVAADPNGVYDFVAWMDEAGYAYTTEELLAGAEYTGNLTALKQRIWNDPFTDVTESDWFYDSVKYCYQAELMNGHTATGFYPYSSATRGQVVTVLYRLAGQPEVTGTMTFTDVPESAYYYDAVAWANTNGIAQGDNASTFRPEDPVTRQEFIVFLHRFAGYLDILLNTWSENVSLASFADSSYVPNWALEAQCWSVVMGLQTGYETAEGTYLNPYSTILRCEMATFLTRFCLSINAIYAVELVQSTVGRTADYALELLGDPVTTHYVDSTQTKGAQEGTWYYEYLLLYTVKLPDGTETVVDWALM